MKSYKIKFQNEKPVLIFNSYIYEDKEFSFSEPSIYPDTIPDYFKEEDWVYLDEDKNVHFIDTRPMEICRNVMHGIMYDANGEIRHIKDLTNAEISNFMKFRVREEALKEKPKLLSGEEEKEYIAYREYLSKLKDKQMPMRKINSYLISNYSGNKILEPFNQFYVEESDDRFDKSEEPAKSFIRYVNMPEYFEFGDWVYINKDGEVNHLDTRPVEKYGYTLTDIKRLNIVENFNFIKGLGEQKEKFIEADANIRTYLLKPIVLSGEAEKKYLASKGRVIDAHMWIKD